MSSDIRDLNDLPDDPFAMPPPYWRSSGAIFHVERSTGLIAKQLEDLLQILPIYTRRADAFDSHDYANPAESESVYYELLEPLWNLEHEIKLQTEIAILMSAIEAEDSINRFSVYNLPKDTANAIEKLSPLDRLIIAATASGNESPKGTHVYECLKHLVSWRNSYAHGHCTDRPRTTLRHNHLIPPDEYPAIPDVIESTRSLVGGYLEVTRYLQSISKNPYGSGPSAHDESIGEAILQIDTFEFFGRSGPWFQMRKRV